MLLINYNFPCDTEHVLTDKEGNFVLLNLSFSGKITLASIYGPNEARPQFYNNHEQNLLGFVNDEVIICGDWNLVIY